MHPDTCPVSRLSVDQLAQILSYVDIKERLKSCSSVSSIWCEAAVQATTSITYSVEDDEKATSFQAWLMAHTAKVHASTLMLHGLSRPHGAVSLPMHQLRSLKSLKLERLAWRPAP